MTPTLLPATEAHKAIIENLMQYYIYDFSEFMELDVDEQGRFSQYPGLSDYWIETESKFPYLIKEEDRLVGFVLVKINQADARKYFSIAEFFILKKYRLRGIGKKIAFQLFDLHKGSWEVFQRVSNKPARIFWSKIIRIYTNDRFTERLEEGKSIQSFES